MKQQIDDGSINSPFIWICSKIILKIFGKSTNYPTYRTFTNEEEAKVWGQSIRKRVHLSKEELDNIYQYTGSYYKTIFWYLICDENITFPDEELDRDIRMLDISLQKGLIPEDIIVYRATRKDTIKLVSKDDIVVPKTYWSTSLLLRSAVLFKYRHLDNKYNCLLKIYISKNTKCLYVSNIESIDDKDWLREYEILLPRNCRYRIIKRHFFSRYLELEVISDN